MSRSWVAPDGITAVLVEALGGGGGGGCYYPDGGGGGGGGAGGIARVVVPVTPGELYLIEPAPGGESCTDAASAEAGGASKFLRASDGEVLLAGLGGSGGGNGTVDRGGSGGDGGHVAGTHLSDGFSFFGPGGFPGLSPRSSCEADGPKTGEPGDGNEPLMNLLTNGAYGFGGRGGGSYTSGFDCGGVSNFNPQFGQPGYVLLTW